MKTVLLLALIALAGGAFAAQPAPTKAAPAKTAPKKVEPPKPTEREVAYAELGQYLNKHVIVRSNLGTVRMGMLTHYSQSQIDIVLDGSNGAQLTFARDSIKSVSVPVAEETQSSDSAKKN